MPTESSRKPRSDALHNHHRILGTARTSFAAGGLDVSMTEIARRAGVGIATLYRHFPAKSDLVIEVFTDQITECVAAIDRALADPDPWHGFRTVIEQLCELQAVDRGLTTVLLASVPDITVFEQERVRVENALAELARRAKAVGRLRPDFVRDDLTLVMMANSGITADSGEDALAASRRLAAYLVQAFQAVPERHPLPPAPRLGPHPALRGPHWR
ncbi:TetR family transcriptional regulator [Nocardiopsis terrae]|uniref:AcrR family transcriptional regulator n=1 Tax=Nocardiopsis terrae TaxID=372655 RepID=A0ABR9HHC0_9ACTN|nr:TetR/AcrR family transcriptional regulator [Nocardiopsis terrae]MBE1458413.1 AcrR family transcriptional regulator [Nocardiopsis terrae]GHC80624.1 TetR family transcriptional regulator [Nocardiopsis terrae]